MLGFNQILISLYFNIDNYMLVPMFIKSIAYAAVFFLFFLRVLPKMWVLSPKYLSFFMLSLTPSSFTGVKWVIEADKYRKIKFCCLQSKAAEPYLTLCGLNREDVLRRFLFIEGPGSYHQASTG